MLSFDNSPLSTTTVCVAAQLVFENYVSHKLIPTAVVECTHASDSSSSYLKMCLVLVAILLLLCHEAQLLE